jgi:hypothetical protein
VTDLKWFNYILPADPAKGTALEELDDGAIKFPLFVCCISGCYFSLAKTGELTPA